MVNQQLLDYIKAELQRGKSKENISNDLLKTGWQSQNIEEAFLNISQPIQTAPVQVPTFPGPVSLLKEAFSIYRQRWLTLLIIALLPILVQILVWIIPVFMVLGNIMLAANKSFSSSPLIGFLPNLSPVRSLWIIIPAFLSAMIVTMLFQLWGQMALLFAIKGYEEKIGIRESYRRGWHKILRFLWVSTLTGLLVTGGLLFFAIPGIIFSIWFSLAIFVLVAEDVGGFSALTRSREYVKGHWWAVVGRMAFMGLFAIIVYFASSLLSSVPKLLHLPVIFNTISSLLSFVINFLLGPLGIIYSFLIYKHLKALKGEISSQSSGKFKFGLILTSLLGFLILGLLIFGIISQWANNSRGININQDMNIIPPFSSTKR